MDTFFLFGYNKSGTTFLQQLVDSHTNVNCPPEHHLNSVANMIKSFCDQYKPLIQKFDDRTAQQGLRFDENIVMRHTFRSFIEAFMLCGAGKTTTHVGINDNSMGLNLEFFAELFPGAKFIAILRDPREITVSLYHHKMRTEEEFRNRQGTLAMVAAAVGPAWANHMEKLKAFEENTRFEGRLYVTRYEDLIGEKKYAELGKIFFHIGLKVDENLIANIFSMNDFEKKRGQNPVGFFRAGKCDTWREELPGEDLRAIESPAGAMMRHYGYNPATENI